MDYHYYRAPSTHKPKRFTFLKPFLPIFMLSLLLPLFLFFALTPNQLDYVSKASNSQSTVSLWFEPSIVSSSPGIPVKVNILGEVSGANTLYNLKFNLKPLDEADISSLNVEYNTPFVGRTNLGTLEITPTKSGNFILSIDSSSVISSEPNIQVKTADLKLSIK